MGAFILALLEIPEQHDDILKHFLLHNCQCSFIRFCYTFIPKLSLPQQETFLILECMNVFFLSPQGVLFTFINTNNSNSDVSKTKSSSSSAPFHEENKEFEDDEIQRRPNSGNHKIGWSGWSDFSTCSRTCDGGVAFQLRRCHSPSGCRGESVRYRICNMQACPDQQDFRAQQCIAFNDVPYDGALFVWSPHYDYSEPCALTCR